MIRKDVLVNIISFLIYVVLQFFLLNKLVLFNKVFCFFYVGFLLFLPQTLGKMYQLAIGLAVGLLVDMFADTIGIHAAACVLIMYLRPYWLNSTTGGKLEEDEYINFRNLGITTFVTYLLPLILVHHATVFIVEGYGFSKFYMTTIKILGSSIFTISVITIIQLFTTSSKKRRI